MGPTEVSEGSITELQLVRLGCYWDDEDLVIGAGGMRLCSYLSCPAGALLI